MAGGQAIDLAAVGKPLEPARARTHARAQDRRADPRRRAARRALPATAAARPTNEAPRPLRQTRRPALPGGRRHPRLHGDTATLGKTAGKDAAADKPTYVSLLGLADARASPTNCAATPATPCALRRARARLKPTTSADF
jgi:farnesyl diphosphate synthase